MTDISRQPQGIPTGGQFAATTHAEPAVSLTATPSDVRTAEYSGTLELKGSDFDPLPEWPKGLPKPAVSFDYENAEFVTSVDVDGATMRFMSNGWEEVTSSEDLGENPWEHLDFDDRYAALAWGRKVHERVDHAVYKLAVDTTRQIDVNDAILAHATEDATPPTKTPKVEVIDADARKARIADLKAKALEAKKDLQHAMLVEPAMKLKEEFPDFDRIRITAKARHGLITAWDADGKVIDKHRVDEASDRLFSDFSGSDFDTLSGQNLDVDDVIGWQPGQ